MATENIPLDRIVADERCLGRERLNQQTADEYHDEMFRSGGWAPFPPAKAIRVDDDFYLYDGFHRRDGYSRLLKSSPRLHPYIPVEWESGTVDDAIERSVRANIGNALRLTPGDKIKNAKTIILLWRGRGKEFQQRDVAEFCGVSPQTVGRAMEQAQSEIPMEFHSGETAATAPVVVKGKERTRPTTYKRKAKAPVPEPPPVQVQTVNIVEPETGEIVTRDVVFVPDAPAEPGNVVAFPGNPTTVTAEAVMASGATSEQREAINREFRRKSLMQELKPIITFSNRFDPDACHDLVNKPVADLIETARVAFGHWCDSMLESQSIRAVGGNRE